MNKEKREQWAYSSENGGAGCGAREKPRCCACQIEAAVASRKMRYEWREKIAIEWEEEGGMMREGHASVLRSVQWQVAIS